MRTHISAILACLVIASGCVRTPTEPDPVQTPAPAWTPTPSAPWMLSGLSVESRCPAVFSVYRWEIRFQALPLRYSLTRDGREVRAGTAELSTGQSIRVKGAGRGFYQLALYTAGESGLYEISCGEPINPRREP